MQPTERPLLKGISHLFACLGYFLVMPYLITLIPHHLLPPLIIYIIITVIHYLISTIFHIINWTDEHKIHIKRLDHIVIYLYMGSVYWALISTLFPTINILVKIVLISGIILGILSRIVCTNLSNVLIAIPYMLVGWCIVLDPWLLYSLVSKPTIVTYLLLAGGLSYTIGGIIYMLAWPNLCPYYFGFHELYHLFAIIGSIIITILIFEVGVIHNINNITY